MNRCAFYHRMLNMSVTDSLVGRVIGLGGNKINSITVSAPCMLAVYLIMCHRCEEGEWSSDHCIQQTTETVRKSYHNYQGMCENIHSYMLLTHLHVCVTVCMYIPVCVCVCGIAVIVVLVMLMAAS